MFENKTKTKKENQNSDAQIPSFFLCSIHSNNFFLAALEESFLGIPLEF